MTFLTHAQLLSSGCLPLAKTSGEAYRTLYTHLAFPGVLIKRLTIDDDVSIIRGFFALATDGVVQIGAGRWRTAALEGSLGVSAQTFEYTDEPNGPALALPPGVAPRTLYRGLRRGPMQLRQPGAHLGVAGLIVPAGDLAGISLPQAVRSLLGSDRLHGTSMDGVPFPSVTNMLFGESGPSLFPGTAALVNASAPGAPTTSNMLNSMMVVRAKLLLSETTCSLAIRNALSRIANNLPDKVSQDRVDGWLAAALASLSTRPAYLVEEDGQRAYVTGYRLAIDGALHGGARGNISIDDFATATIQMDDMGPDDGPRAGFGTTYYNDKSLYSGGKLRYTLQTSLFDGVNFLWRWESTTFDQAEETFIAGNAALPMAKVLGQTLVLLQSSGSGAVDVAMPSKEQLDPSMAPLDASVAAAGALKIKFADKRLDTLALRDLWLQHGAVVASVASATDAGDQWLANQS